MPIIQLHPELPVTVVARDLPVGVTPNNRKGVCIAWWLEKDTHLWLICFDETGEFVWVPIHEIRMAPSWSDGRRYSGDQLSKK